MTIAQRLRHVADITRAEEVHIKALLREAADALQRAEAVETVLTDECDRLRIWLAAAEAERDEAIGGEDADTETIFALKARLAAADDALLQSHKRERELEARLAAAEEGWRKAAQGEKE